MKVFKPNPLQKVNELVDYCLDVTSTTGSRFYGFKSRRARVNFALKARKKKNFKSASFYNRWD